MACCLSQREPSCAWAGTTSCYALRRQAHTMPDCHQPPEPLPSPKPVCGRCCSPAEGGCFYQQPWSRGFSLIPCSSFLQPWICIKSWVKTSLIPGWEHCIMPSKPSQTGTRLGVTPLETKPCRDNCWVFLRNRRCLLCRSDFCMPYWIVAATPSQVSICLQPVLPQ